MYVNNPQFPPLPPKGGIDPGRKRKLALYGTLTGLIMCLAVLFGLSWSGVLRLQGFGHPSAHLSAQGEKGGPSLLNAQGASGSGLLQAQGEEGSQVLDAQAEQGSPLLAAQGESAAATLSAKSETTTLPLLTAKPVSDSPPVLSSSAPTKTEMPADVRDWLEHLRKTEAKRAETATDQVSEAMTLIGSGGNMGALQGFLNGDEGSNAEDKISANEAVNASEKMRSEWVQIMRFFNSKKPPAECVALRNQYATVLEETGSMILEIIDIVKNASNDAKGAISRLQSMMGKSKSRIDVPASRADDGVKAICLKYDTPKWFDIKADFGGGLMSKLGL